MSTWYDGESTQVDRLADAVDRLREQSEADRREIAVLKAEVARLGSADTGATSSPAHNADGSSNQDVRTDRRGLLMMGGAAAVAAAGTALGTGLLSATPAAAANGGSVLLGEVNSASATTEVDSTSGTGLYGTTQAAGNAGTRGDDLSTGGAFGVYGYSTNNYGLFGQGGRAPLALSTAGSAGPPTAGVAHELGEVYFDSDGMLYTCVAAGDPGTWASSRPSSPRDPPGPTTRAAATVRSETALAPCR